VRTAQTIVFEFAVVAAMTVCTSSEPPGMGSNVDDGVLTVVEGSGDDRIVVGCSAEGNVRVNGRRPDSGTAACEEVASITVNSGGGGDVIRLANVGTTEFPGLSTVSVDSGDGPDVVSGSQVADSIVAGAGDDRIFATPAVGDSVLGDDGLDSLLTKIDSDVTISDDGFTSSGGSFTIGSIESLVVTGGSGGESIDGRAFSGSLKVTSNGGDDRVFGGSGENVLNTGSGDDEVTGGPDRDLIVTGDGKDSLEGGGGRNDLQAGNGDDVVLGGPDRDVIAAGDGADVVSGGGGWDDISGIGVRDEVHGGAGNDTFSLTEEGTRYPVDGGEGTDLLRLRLGSLATLTDSALDTEFGAWPLRSIETADLYGWERSGDMRVDARGFSGSVLLRADYGNDVLIGGTGDDTISGSVGDDELLGGPGHDTLDGGRGADLCDGGAGKDRRVHCETGS
jgi:Ca2+-binding RTX toxin-like protein